MSYESEKTRYKELLASGSKPSEALHIIDAEKSKGMHKESKQEPQREPIKDVHVPAVKGSSNKIGAGIGKIASGLNKFLFTPGGRKYDEKPDRFKNTGRFKHDRKEKHREQKQERRVVSVPINPFASDFQSSGGFSSDLSSISGKLSHQRNSKEIGSNPFASDMGHVERYIEKHKKKKSKGITIHITR